MNTLVKLPDAQRTHVPRTQGTGKGAVVIGYVSELSDVVLLQCCIAYLLQRATNLSHTALFCTSTAAHRARW